MTKMYEVLEDGFIASNYYKKGDVAPFAPAAVQFLCEPYGSRLKPAGDKKPATKKKAGA